MRGKPFKKGHKKLPGAGRKAGTKNKATLQRADILGMVLGALEKAGGQKTFESWANSKKKISFLKEVIGLIPKEENLNVKQTISFAIEQPVIQPEKKG